MVAFVLLLAPRSSHGQVDQVVLAGRELITAAAETDSGRGNRLRHAAVTLGQALGEWDRAIQEVHASAVRELPSAAPARAFQLHVELGLVYRTRGRVPDALREFDAAAALQPNNSDLQFLRALSLEWAGQAELAKDAFVAAWRLDAEDPTKAYHALRGSRLATPADRARARAALEGVYQSLLRSDSRPTRTPFAEMHVLPDSASPTPIVGDERTGHGFNLLAAGAYSEGVAALTQPSTAASDPNTSPAVQFREAQRLEAEGQAAAARRAYAAAVTGTLAGRSPMHTAIGRLALVDGDVTAAIAAYREAVRLNPGDATTRLELANAYVVHGSMGDAVTEVLGGLLLNPMSAQLHAGLGRLRLESGQPADAIPSLTRALELSPDQYELRYALATAFTRTGRSAEAATQLQLFERVRRELLERRRAAIQQEVEKQEAARPNPNDGAGQ